MAITQAAWLSSTVGAPLVGGARWRFSQALSHRPGLMLRAAMRTSVPCPSARCVLRHFRSQPARAIHACGYSLIEVLITMLVLSLLTILAVSSFSSHLKRARAAEAIENLDIYRTRMEKAFQNNGNYGNGACAVPLPSGVYQFVSTCLLAPDGQAFTALFTGSLGMAGYIFSINDRGLRRTESFPGASVPANCWMVEKNKCK